MSQKCTKISFLQHSLPAKLHMPCILPVLSLAYFLLLNGHMAVAKDFFIITENISYQVAAGKINKELLHRIMTAIMDGTYELDEELKLAIYNAIS